MIRPRTSNNSRDRRNKREKLLKRDGNVCWKCSEEFTEDNLPVIDHIIRVDKGGTHEMSNLKLAHFSCKFPWARMQRISDYSEWARKVWYAGNWITFEEYHRQTKNKQT